jgi:scyllo-inositol 2-dehydrogenase (NADP+)
MGTRCLRVPIRCAVVGYGATHNFGRAHGRWIAATPELAWVAVCDCDPERLTAAQAEFPALAAYESVTEMLAKADLDLIAVVTPNHTHAPIAMDCMAAGKHVVVDEAMCLNIAEADAMIAAAEANHVTLAVCHVRRHDGNYRAIKEVIAAGEIGDVFHIELAAGDYGRPRNSWYSQKASSGGAFYYWGPHAIDWVLDLVDARVCGVNGFYHKLVWMDLGQEEQTRAILRFDDGCIADITWSHIAAVTKPLWRILGTHGGILDSGVGANRGFEEDVEGPSGGSLEVVTIRNGQQDSWQVPYKSSDWQTYYAQLADHLLRGAPVPVSAEEGRRTIAVFEAAERSSRTGQTAAMAHEDWEAGGDGWEHTFTGDWGNATAPR